MTDNSESYHSYYQGPVSDHFDGTHFFNPWAKRPDKGLWDVLKWRMEGNRADWPESVKNDPRPPIDPEPAGWKVTFIGHASLLVQMNSHNILIDPVFSERMSPFSHIGPKRVRPPFLPLEALPDIHTVFVSHNHYDHLDLPSLAWLAANRKPHIITPLGNPRIIKGCVNGCTITALDWHEAAPLAGGLSLTVTPAQHWSRRGFNDINRDLWGGCMLKDKTSGKSFYYSGDSGFYAGLFEDIRTRHGAPDIACLPIGAYAPRWFMQYSHMNPEEAVRAFRLLGAKRGMGFHFETVQLTDEPYGEPRAKTMEALRKENIRDGDFMIPHPGDSMTV